MTFLSVFVIIMQDITLNSLIMTFILAPSAPPEVVRAVRKTMHSIRVTWTEVPVDRQNGDILKYTVSYQKDADSSLRHKLVIRAPRRFANLTKLTDDTRYNITVRASNQNGRGPPSDSTTVTTSNGSKLFLYLTYTIRKS